MRSVLQLIVLAVAFASLIGCGTSPEDARQKLADLNIEYTQESFADHAGRGDHQAVDLFVKAGMNPDHALNTAVASGNEETVGMLLDAGADPVAPQARPILTLLGTAKNGDLEQFKTVFSEKYRQEFSERGWNESFQRYQKVVESAYGEYEPAEFTFEYEGNEQEGQLTVLRNGEKSGSIQVVKENGDWRMNER